MASPKKPLQLEVKKLKTLSDPSTVKGGLSCTTW